MDLGGHRERSGESECMAGSAAGSAVPIVYLDALIVKTRQDGKVENRAVYTAIGINMEGQKSVLGL